MMKKIVCLLLAMVFLTVLCGCSTQMTAVENYLIALKKADMNGMETALTSSDTTQSALFNHLNEDEKAALQSLYALIQYTIGEVAEEKDAKFVDVTLKIPNMQKILSLAEKQMLVTAESGEQIIREMVGDGTVTKTLMTEMTVSVKMTQASGVWKIARDDNENRAFFDAIALTNMMQFIANY